ncbi:MAG: alpha/beta hydrolase [Bacteroidales bacterium]|nr:alpha/beta hydrolase [Bacteroidales bacterium]
MKKVILGLSLTLGLLSIACNAKSQQFQQPEPPKEVIKIWDGKIPGSKPNAELEKKAENPENQFWITAVTTPSLDYYPATNNDKKTAVIICPGGSYCGLTYLFEGTMAAQWFNSIGITAFVLKYRLPKDEIMENRSIGPLQDVQQAIRYVRSKAKEFEIDENKIGIVGFSAGGHLASTASTHYNDKVYDSKLNVSARPDFTVLIYPVISMDPAISEAGTHDALIGKDANQELTDRFSNEKQVTKDTPPAFLAHALNDKLVTYKNSSLYVDALRANDVECELHLYSRGDHGLGAKNPIETQAFWHEDCERWLRMKELVK